MGVGNGIFNIIQRGQFSTAAATIARNYHQTQKSAGDSGTEHGTDPTKWSLKKNESAVSAFWRLAPEEAAKRAPAQDVVKRLEKMAEGDNNDIAAEKMRQAKAKLDGLRRQLQMLAASGDVRQLRRIAAEAASLAREIGVAARSMAQGIGAGSTPTEASSAQATASAAQNAAAQASKPAATPAATSAAAPAGGTAEISAAPENELEASFKALHQLTSDARNAVTQAKGIITLAAQLARARRRGDADDAEDRFSRRLQEEADGALAEIDAGQREALSGLLAPETGSETGTVLPGAGADLGGMSLDITVETLTITETRIEILA